MTSGTAAVTRLGVFVDSKHCLPARKAMIGNLHSAALTAFYFLVLMLTGSAIHSLVPLLT